MRYDIFVSIVVPLNNNADIIEDIIEEIASVLKKNYKNYEMIFVDDDSLDDTRYLFEELKTKENCLRYLKLSRSFGLETAIACGLDVTIGDVVVVLRPEFDPPELIVAFVEQALACKGIVIGQRNLFETRSWLYRLAYNFYYRLCQLLLERPHIYCSTHYIALTRTALNGLLRIKDNYRYFRLLSMYGGYRVKILKYKQIKRRKQPSHRKLIPLINDCISMIVSNSVRPLRLAGAIASLTSVFNLFYVGYVIFLRLFFSWVQPGWASMSLQNATMFGLLFLLLGVICEYLTRLLENVKARPLYFIEEEMQSVVMLTDTETRNVVHNENSSEGVNEPI